jgi:hypothetical protein
LIAASNSFKFYTPLTGQFINDIRYNHPPRETPLAQELYTVGYYIFTVDGAMVTVDYYASANGCGGDCDLSVTPSLTFSKRETYGYGLNGKQFIIPRGSSLTVLRDTVDALDGCFGTRMAVLGGSNVITGTFFDGRPTSTSINTSWRSRSTIGSSVKSDAVTLMGMQDSVGSFGCDPYVLSMSYDPVSKGPLALSVRNEGGEWVRAVVVNGGGARKFIIGAWKETFELGTYGIDPATKTVWAVVSQATEFAVAPSTDGDQNNDGVIDNTDVGIVLSLRGEEAGDTPEADLDNDGKITILDARKLALLKN